MHKILIIGGTAEGFKIASFLNENNYSSVLSLQGNTLQPRQVNYVTRSGGFGGIDGLKNYLNNNCVSVIIDASHPYSTQISNNVKLAARELKIKLFILHRPEWQKKYFDHWIHTNSFNNTRAIVETLPRESRLFLTIGKKYIPLFSDCKQWLMIRTIDPYIAQPQGNRKYITGRGPFHVSQELILLRENKITHLVSRNSGSIETYAKVEAARILGIEIIMIDRNENTPRKSSQIDVLMKDTLSYLGRNK